ncbi:MAG: hypothetical protein ACU0CO_09220 [Shimia sp.]
MDDQRIGSDRDPGGVAETNATTDTTRIPTCVSPTDPTPPNEGDAAGAATPAFATPAERLARSGRRLNDVIRDLTTTSDKVRDGAFGDLRELDRIQRNLRAALTSLEEAEHELERRHGTATDGPDHDAIRAEIGRRLDRLRSA